MRVLHTIASADPRGGGPIEAIKNLAHAMESVGHRIEVATIDTPNADFVKSLGFCTHALGPGRGKYSYSARFQSWIAEHAREYDAVVVNGIWQFSSYAVWRALRKGPVPYFVFTHGMLDPWFKHYYPLKHLKKWLYWPWAEYRVLRDARAVLFTAEEERLLARKSFWLYRCTERVVRYGVASPPVSRETGLEAVYSRFPEFRGKRLWLFLGRMHPKKCGDDVIRAFAALKESDPALHLVMAGPDDSECAAEWKSLAENLNLDGRITWTGMLSGAPKWGALYAAEVFVLPSHQENFGIAVVEALACGTPAVISKRVNIWREVVSANAGIAAEDNFEATASALKQFHELKPEDRECMKKNAERCFAENFHVSRTVESMLDIFAEFNVRPRASAGAPT